MKLKSFTKKDRHGNMTSFEFFEDPSLEINMTSVPMMEGIPDHPGDPKGTDTVPAWLTPGEYVMNAEATRIFEPQIEQMNNVGRAVQEQQGGSIPEYSAHGGQVGKPTGNYTQYGKPIFRTDEGEYVSEKGMSIPISTMPVGLGKIYNIPSIQDGVMRNEDFLREGIQLGKLNPTGVYDTINEAIKASKKRSKSLEPTEYASGGPVYMNQGGWLDSLLGMFSGNDNSELPDATIGAVPPAVDARSGRVANLSNAMFPQGPTRPDPKLSNEILMNLLKDKEGFRDKAYLDSAGIPTIGYGFTEGVQMGDTMNEEVANKRLLQEMARTDRDYNNLVTADLNPNQEAAVKSLIYNIGGPKFANSKARAALNAGDFESFQKEAAEFRMADGKVIPGLENRRRDELELFFKPYKADRPSVEDSPTAMIPSEDILDWQQNVRRLQKDGTYEATSDVGDPFPPEPETPVDAEMIAAQAATARDGMYNSGDNDMGGLGSDTPENAERARLLREQQRMQQDQVPPMAEANVPLPDELVGPEMNNVDDRGALQKWGESGGLMGFLDRKFGQDESSGSDVPLPDELVGPEMGEEKSWWDSITDRFSSAEASSEPFDKDNLPDNLVWNEKTGKVEYKEKSEQPASSIQHEIDRPEGAQAKAFRLRTAKEDMQKAIDNGYGPGDAIFDNAYARVQELEGADEELARLQDEKKLIFTQGEIKVTAAEIEKKTNQAEQLVDLGLLDAAAKVEQEVAELKAKQKRLEKQSENLTPPPVDAPPMPDELSGTSMDGGTTKEDMQTSLEEIVKGTDKDKDNGPTDKSPDEVEKTGKEAPPEDINKAKGFFQSILGDLFDEGELQRMAIMYVGGRMLGGSHNGSLNFAAKQYVKRVDAKASAHDKFVKDLIKDGTYKAKSINTYKRTKNLADLEKKDATYAPTGGAPVTKMVPQFNKKGDIIRYTKETLVPVKSSADSGTYYQTASGSVIHPSRFASLPDYREELDDNTEAYKQRRSRILGDMEGYFEEIRDGSPDNYTEEDGKRTYRVGVGPKQAALAYYDWAKRQGVDPDSTAGRKVMNQAYENMVMEAKSEGIKFTPNDFTRYLEAQQLRETTGAPELFITNMDKVKDKKAAPEYVRADKMDLLYQNLDTVISKIPGSSTRRGDIIGIAIKKWNGLDKTDDGRALKKKYEKSAVKTAGESGFYKYMMDTAEALHAEINKPKE